MGGVIITVLFPCYLFQSDKSVHLHYILVAFRSPFAYLQSWTSLCCFLRLDCVWSVMTLIMKDNFVDSIRWHLSVHQGGFTCEFREHWLILDTRFDSWIVLLHLLLWETTTCFSFFEFINGRYFLLVKMVQLNKELAYRTTVERSMGVCWLLDWYHICHSESCIEILLAWFWCAVDVNYQISEELWTNDMITGSDE